jgi:outer membrane protein OmpA-like peptidoglycan-associated protein/Tol biopolymer transport system component
MKHLTSIIIVFFLGSSVLFAQQTNPKAAANALKSYQQGVNDMRIGRNKEALAAFRDAISKDKNLVEAYWQMADVYKTMADETRRISTLQRIAAPSYPKFYQTSLRLGIAQYENGIYNDALKTFSAIKPEEKTARIQEWIEKCEVAINLKNNPVPFDPKNLGPLLNTIYDDYWPSITADEQTMSTTVLYGKLPGSSVTMGIHEEIYHSQKVDGEWTQSINIGPPTNTMGNEGAQTFSVDGRYMFFVACDRRTGLGGCDIYYSIKNGDEWSSPINPGEPLNSKYWETSPSFSAAGDELFFSSNRPGGVGNKDIWKCKVQIAESGKLTFSDPVNLGAPINTEDDEFSPFIHADDKTMYFSSTGHPGLGGYDVFVTRRTGKNAQWSTPKNIGYPLNTHKDEIGFVVNANGDKAYFSSDGILQNGRGKDIYEVSLYEEIRPNQVKYFKGKIYDYDKKEPIRAQIELYRLEDDVIVYKSVSDSKTGEYLASVPADKEYGINVHKKGYLFYSGHLSETDTLDIRLNEEIELPKIEVGRSLVLKNVFFDFDLYNLKPKSRAELDRLYAFLKTNATVQLELAGHTDAKGPYEHNITLSYNRAKAVFDYLVKKGINPNRLKYIGYGPDKPIATNETDEGRALNRRTEAIVIGR